MPRAAIVKKETSPLGLLAEGFLASQIDAQKLQIEQKVRRDEMDFQAGLVETASERQFQQQSRLGQQRAVTEFRFKQAADDIEFERGIRKAGFVADLQQQRFFRQKNLTAAYSQAHHLAGKVVPVLSDLTLPQQKLTVNGMIRGSNLFLIDEMRPGLFNILQRMENDAITPKTAARLFGLEGGVSEAEEGRPTATIANQIAIAKALTAAQAEDPNPPSFYQNFVQAGRILAGEPEPEVPQPTEANFTELEAELDARKNFAIGDGERTPSSSLLYEKIFNKPVPEESLLDWGDNNHLFWRKWDSTEKRQYMEWYFETFGFPEAVPEAVPEVAPEAAPADASAALIQEYITQGGVMGDENAFRAWLRTRNR